jgi:hypothetical protein
VAVRAAEPLHSPNGHDHDALEPGRGIDARTAPAVRGVSMFAAGNASVATGDSGAAYAEIAAQLAE